MGFRKDESDDVDAGEGMGRQAELGREGQEPRSRRVVYQTNGWRRGMGWRVCRGKMIMSYLGKVEMSY